MNQSNKIHLNFSFTITHSKFIYGLTSKNLSMIADHKLIRFTMLIIKFNCKLHSKLHCILSIGLLK